MEERTIRVHLYICSIVCVCVCVLCFCCVVCVTLRERKKQREKGVICCHGEREKANKKRVLDLAFLQFRGAGVEAFNLLDGL